VYKPFKHFYKSSQGLCVRVYSEHGGVHEGDYTTRVITQTANGHTEIPLILALSHHKCNGPDRMDANWYRYTQTLLYFKKKVNIRAICDVDIEALKTAHQKSVYIQFADISPDAIISPRISELNNTKIDCNIIPKTLECNQQLQRGDDPRNPHLTVYYTTYPYWRLKAVASIGLFCGIWYLAKKYIIDESNTFVYCLQNTVSSRAINSLKYYLIYPLGGIQAILTIFQTSAVQEIHELENNTSLNFFVTSMYKILLPPVHGLVTLAVSVFKPKWLPYHIDQRLKIQHISFYR
jgi:hypothetical protein